MKKKTKKEKSKSSIALLITTIILFIGFTVWSILVSFNKFDTLNIKVHDFILHLFLSETSEKIFKGFTFCGTTLCIVSLAAIVFFILVYKKKYGKAIGTGSIIAISTIINNVVKVIVREPRPAYMPVGMESTFAYPSGHSMASVTLYGFFILLISKSTIPKKYKWFYSILLGALALGVMTSRIYLGAHYFSDIIGALLCSLTLIFLFMYLDKRFGIFAKLDDNKTINKKLKRK